MADWQLEPSKLKRYPHFDQAIKPADVMALVMNPKRVAQNSFYPMLRYTKSWEPFHPGKSSGLAKPKKKERPIRYAARRDAYIFAYYRHLLSEPYEAELHRLGIADCPVAYRRIASDSNGGRGKCNIHFAHDVVRKIRELGSCCVIAIDISSYFETLNHQRLKALWCRLLGVDRLPDDHFAVFTNITKYSVVDRLQAYERLGHFGEKSRTKGGIPIRGYLTPYKEIPTQLCSPFEFRQKIMGENGLYPSLVEQNKLPYGIPQGAPISDLLANLYLIDFDVEMQGLATSLGGSYVRYSDDILLTLPVAVHDAQAIMDSMPARITKYGAELIIKPEKSSLVEFTPSAGGHQAFQCIAGKGRNGLEYLGFRYNGRNVFLRDATLGNLYRRVAKVARSQAEATVRRYPDKDYSRLCELFNFEEFKKRFGRVEDFDPGASKNSWTFWTYVTRVTEEFGPLGRQVHRQLRKLHRHARYRVDTEMAVALTRRSKREKAMEAAATGATK